MDGAPESLPGKVVAIHQPNFLPWPGWFAKLARADEFVVIDHVQFTKGHVVNRTRVKDPRGRPAWLTVPVRLSEGSMRPINEIRVDRGPRWPSRALNQLRSYYGTAPGFDAVFPGVEEILWAKVETLGALNLMLIEHIATLLGLATPLVVASDLPGELGRKNDLNLGLCRRLGADVYLSGQGARKYNDEARFSAAGIELVYLDYEPPVYPQAHGEFVPGLSVIDLLMNVGPDEAPRYIR